jgi:hypothetical protein
MTRRLLFSLLFILVAGTSSAHAETLTVPPSTSEQGGPTPATKFVYGHPYRITMSGVLTQDHDGKSFSYDAIYCFIGCSSVANFAALNWKTDADGGSFDYGVMPHAEGGKVPAYSDSHSYTVTVREAEGHMTFRAFPHGRAGEEPVSGSFTVTVEPIGTPPWVSEGVAHSHVLNKFVIPNLDSCGSNYAEVTTKRAGRAWDVTVKITGNKRGKAIWRVGKRKKTEPQNKLAKKINRGCRAS